jgi:hypothetical protein
MRRILAPLLLLLLLPICVKSQTPANAAPPSTESAQLRATAQTLLATGSTDDTLKAAELLDKASEIDARNAEILKTNAQRKQLEQSGPTWKSFVNDFSPLITVLVLAGTFIFNMSQARIAEREKREDDDRQREDKRQDIARQDSADEKKRADDETKRYTDAMELIQKAEDFSPTAALIRTFTTEPYRSEARQIGRDVLLLTKSYDRFQDLFNTVVEPVTYENIGLVINLLRTVHINFGPLLTKSWVKGVSDFSSFTPKELAMYDLLLNERKFLSVKVATALKQPRDSTIPFDLSNLGFDACSFTGVDLRNTIITPAVWNRVNLDGADLRGIIDFQNCWFFDTAWWHAAHIDQPFIDYLKINCAYKDAQDSNSPQPISQKDYDENITRLETLAQRDIRGA